MRQPRRNWKAIDGPGQGIVGEVSFNVEYRHTLVHLSEVVVLSCPELPLILGIEWIDGAKASVRTYDHVGVVVLDEFSPAAEGHSLERPIPAALDSSSFQHNGLSIEYLPSVVDQPEVRSIPEADHFHHSPHNCSSIERLPSVVGQPEARSIPEAVHSHHSPRNLSSIKYLPSEGDRSMTRSTQEVEGDQTHFSVSFPTGSLPAATDQISSGSITAAAGLVGRKSARQGKTTCIKSGDVLFDLPLPREPVSFILFRAQYLGDEVLVYPSISFLF